MCQTFRDEAALARTALLAPSPGWPSLVDARFQLLEDYSAKLQVESHTYIRNQLELISQELCESLRGAMGKEVCRATDFLSSTVTQGFEDMTALVKEVGSEICDFVEDVADGCSSGDGDGSRFDGAPGDDSEGPSDGASSLSFFDSAGAPLDGLVRKTDPGSSSATWAPEQAAAVAEGPSYGSAAPPPTKPAPMPVPAARPPAASPVAAPPPSCKGSAPRSRGRGRGSGASPQQARGRGDRNPSSGASHSRPRGCSDSCARLEPHEKNTWAASRRTVRVVGVMRKVIVGARNRQGSAISVSPLRATRA